MLDILRRPDITLHIYAKIQGVAEKWNCAGDITSHTGDTVKDLIRGDRLAVSYGSAEAFVGIARSGHLRLDLLDRGGYLADLLSSGTETQLTAEVGKTDTTINVASTAAFPATGAIHIHRERITYTGKTGTTFTGCTRATADHAHTYSPTHAISLGSQPTAEGITAAVRVGTTPLYLEGRYASLYAIALDNYDTPISDAGGVWKWEIWRGIVTAVPPSPDAVGYTLQAETLERLITDDPPTAGINGHLLTGAWSSKWGAGGNKQWGAYESPCFIPWRRRKMALRFYENNKTAGTVTVYDVGVNVLADNHGSFMTPAQIAEAFQASASSTVSALLSCRFELAPLEDGEDEETFRPRFWCRFADTGGGGPDIDWTVAALHGESDIWRQLGFYGDGLEGGGYYHPAAHTTAADEDETYIKGDELPATIMLTTEEDEIPVLSNDPDPPSTGFIDIDDEAIFYADTETDHLIDGVQAYVLTGCRRGYADTYTKEIVYRMGDAGASDLPEVSPLYCIGGNGVLGADEPDANVWITLLATLTGCNGTATNGSFDDWPGLGIPTEHFDVVALDNLGSMESLTGPLYGAVDDLRDWLSDALALEGYTLVTRPHTDGTCKLTPVRMGAVSSNETPEALEIEASEGVQVHGGLGALVNRVTVKAGKSTAKFIDRDSVAQFNVRQLKTYNLPLADSAGLLRLAGCVRRIFHLAGKLNSFTADFAVDPAGRMIAPGDVIALTFPNSDLTGNWRVLDATTTIRGDGTIRVSAMRVTAWTNYIYAPTSTVVDLPGGTDIEIDIGDGQWFTATGSTLRVFDPDDYGSSAAPRLDARDGDVLTLNSVAGINVGDVVEFSTYADASGNGEDRFVWFVDDTFTWGD